MDALKKCFEVANKMKVPEVASRMYNDIITEIDFYDKDFMYALFVKIENISELTDTYLPLSYLLIKTTEGNINDSLELLSKIKHYNDKVDILWEIFSSIENGEIHIDIKKVNNSLINFIEKEYEEIDAEELLDKLSHLVNLSGTRKSSGKSKQSQGKMRTDAQPGKPEKPQG